MSHQFEQVANIMQNLYEQDVTEDHEALGAHLTERYTNKLAQVQRQVLDALGLQRQVQAKVSDLF